MQAMRSENSIPKPVSISCGQSSLRSNTLHLMQHFVRKAQTKGTGGRTIRNQPTIDEDSRLKLDELDMLAIAASVGADLRLAPAVNRDVEWRAGRQRWHEAGQCWDTETAEGVRELGIRQHVACHSKLLEGNLVEAIGRAWKQKNIPVLKTHCGSVQYSGCLGRGTSVGFESQRVQVAGQCQKQDGASIAEADGSLAKLKQAPNLKRRDAKSLASPQVANGSGGIQSGCGTVHTASASYLPR
jgi:hypothetical protein